MDKCKGLGFHAIVLLTVAAFFVTFILPKTLYAEEINIPTGTSVQLSTNALLSPASVNVGDAVELTVTSDVVIDGKVVIKAGAPAKGEIIQAKDENYIGIAAKVGLAIRTVEAVDGTSLMLSGTKLVEGKDKMAMSIGLSIICCILFALVRGGSASIPAGTVIDCIVTTSSTVNI
jgi:hypothetical protein